MNEEIKKEWVAALRSGEYKQVRGYLKNGDGYCCLGVLCEIAVNHGVIPPGELPIGSEYFTFGGAGGVLPPKVVEWAGLPSGNPDIGYRPATGWNDTYGVPFPGIADLIEKYL